MDNQDNNVAFYMLNSKKMKKFLGVIQRIDKLGKMRRFPKDRLQLEVNLDNENGLSDEFINLSTDSSNSILNRLRNAYLYLIDNYSDNKTEWMRVQRLGSERYWIKFPRNSYEAVSALEKELHKIVYSDALNIPSAIIYSSGKLDSIHKPSRYRAMPDYTPDNKKDKISIVLDKRGNERLSQSQINVMVSGVRAKRIRV